MQIAMVSPAQRYRELIAHLATERTRLRKTQMMRIRRTPTANQARLFDDMPDMVAVTNALRFGEDKVALVDLWCLLVQGLISKYIGNVVSFCAIWRDHCEFGGERFLHLLVVGCRQLVLCPVFAGPCRIKEQIDETTLIAYLARCTSSGMRPKVSALLKSEVSALNTLPESF